MSGPQTPDVELRKKKEPPERWSSGEDPVVDERCQSGGSQRESTPTETDDTEQFFTDRSNGRVSKCGCHTRSCWKKVLCGVVIFCIALAILMTWRHESRGHELEPLLAAIASSAVCLHAATGTCALDFDHPAVAAFDLHPAEHPLFGFLFAQLLRRDRDQMRNVLKGAHIMMNDDLGGNRTVYGFLTTLEGARKRISSHRSDRAQYGIPEGRVVSTMLVGHLDGNAWFQLEGAPWNPGSDPVGAGCHALDFVEYRLFGCNVGPLGTSRNTDRNPLTFKEALPASEVCPQECRAPSAITLLQRAMRYNRRHAFLQGVISMPDAGQLINK